VSTAAPTALDFLNKGREAEKADDVAAAAQSYIEALALDPGNPTIQKALDRASRRLAARNQGALRDKKEKFVLDAERQIERTLQTTDDLQARIATAQKLMAQGKLLQAADLFDQVVETAPHMEDAWKGLKDLGRIAGARLRKGRFPSPAHQSAAEGLVSYVHQNWDKAAEALGAVLTSTPLAPEHADGHLARLEAIARKRADAARAQKDRDTFLALAALHQKEGRLKEARELLQQVLNRNPGDKEARERMETLGSLFSAVQENAREETRQKTIEDHLRKGTALMIQDRHKEALEEMTRVLELDPGNRDALARLREIKQDMKGSHGFVPAVGEAQQKYREGLKLYGDERYAEAKTAFEEALRLNPKDTDARQALDHLLDELASPSPTAAP
jgi:tetratricopeptide (TPR) repeat protein